MRLLLLLVGVLPFLPGCAADHSRVRANDEVERGLGAPVGASLRVSGAPAWNGLEEQVAFFPVELLESGLAEAGYHIEFVEFGSTLQPDSADEPGGLVLAMARRPARRGGPGGLRRRAPPLLNPRPTPEQRLEAQRRAADLQAILTARQLYAQRLQEALARYPNSTGYQDHHFTPIYLGGLRSGVTYRIPTAYHIAITQEFRSRWGYAKGPPNPEQRMKILIAVYSKYPIPQLIGITP